MKMNLYSVYDKISKLYTQPMILLNDDIALRIIANCVRNPEHNYSLNPEDYSLYRVGSFDDNTAEILQENVFIVRCDSIPQHKSNVTEIRDAKVK